MVKGGAGPKRGKGRRRGKGAGGIGDGPVAVTLPAAALGVPGTSAVEVGYSAPYAVYVHEDLKARHPNGGNAKFLSGPAESLLEELGQAARGAMSEGAGRRAALLEAGDLLLGASQQQVPVDTGFLRDSGYVRITRGS